MEVPQMADPLDELAENNENGGIDFGKVGRNQPCPCGSGKKFKHCHGAVR